MSCWGCCGRPGPRGAGGAPAPAWGYGPEDGPERWHEHFPLARGRRQSPVDIRAQDTRYDAALRPLHFGYEAAAAQSIANNGHTVQAQFGEGAALAGGPLAGPYRLAQLHLHWGSGPEQGSEHTLEGRRFPAELHLVHWRARYPRLSEALSRPDGLAVVAVLLRLGPPCPALEPLLGALGSVRTRGTQAPCPALQPRELLPACPDFWTYPGSLTTPPLLESVTWLVLREPVAIGAEQLGALRGLLSSAAGEPPRPLQDNWRPCQPLHGRELRASFR
ncbi:carbonic anhydrase-like [Gopherus evgoodei]|uniref:carbonic anhydrase-like n=1 Tax=Gopherus evgoodei TaxID=1825980 RepID=UPI0011D021E4|nr:carbonic anhydrase-like [Gopherus evgoodei]